MRIIIVDYGAGNLRSVARAVAHVGSEPYVTQDPYDVAHADAVIVPGVGAAADTMRNLRLHKMVEPIREYIASGRPFFGVCMGQQALLSVSEEGGQHECLGVIPGRVVRLPSAQQTANSKQQRSGVRDQGSGAVEQIANSKQQNGANTSPLLHDAGRGLGGEVAPTSDLQPPTSRLKVPHMGWNRVRQVREHAIFDGIDDGAYFYFVHSYYPAPEDPSVVIGETEYGVTFASVLARENIVATQFHPEKSGDAGLRMYRNFITMAGARDGAEAGG
jgi:glutamine amidotransferase